jgi:hypothetical protein
MFPGELDGTVAVRIDCGQQTVAQKTFYDLSSVQIELSCAAGQRRPRRPVLVIDPVRQHPDRELVVLQFDDFGTDPHLLPSLDRPGVHDPQVVSHRDQQFPIAHGTSLSLKPRGTETARPQARYGGSPDHGSRRQEPVARASGRRPAATVMA